MKHALILFAFFLCQLGVAQAQTAVANPHDTAAKTATESLVTKYRLNQQQEKEMLKVQTRKFKNLAKIESIKSEDPAKYRKKLENLQHGMLGSILRILKGDEQLATYNQTQVEVRNQKAAKRKELAASGATKEAIEGALLEIYAE